MATGTAMPQRSASGWRRAFVTIGVGLCYTGYALSKKTAEEREIFWQNLGSSVGKGVSNFAANPVQIMEQSSMLKYVALYVFFKIAANIFRNRVERAAARADEAEREVPTQSKAREIKRDQRTTARADCEAHLTENVSN